MVSLWIAVLIYIIDVQDKVKCILVFNQVPVYIAEITPKNLRGGFTTVHQVEPKSLKDLEINVNSTLIHTLMACSAVDDMLWRVINISNWSFCKLAGFGSYW